MPVMRIDKATDRAVGEGVAAPVARAADDEKSAGRCFHEDDTKAFPAARQSKHARRAIEMYEFGIIQETGPEKPHA